ncbi:HIT domain-containing protein [Pelagibacteraceae bacterium]|nr:HIT domain-containing protein [Pelagibacteraceae bacterium]|tara:strand:- start:186 stop:548 length:363 start_codon:yes stop_codon:yes gene_type:complete
MNYDKNNIFAKILRGEIPCKKVYENEYVLSFHDANPQKKIHVLVIPKGAYIDLDDFIKNASDKEIVEFNKAIVLIVKMLKISNQEDGYRVLSNIGKNSGQEVSHLHYHIFGGELIGKMVN